MLTHRHHFLGEQVRTGMKPGQVQANFQEIDLFPEDRAMGEHTSFLGLPEQRATNRVA